MVKNLILESKKKGGFVPSPLPSVPKFKALYKQADPAAKPDLRSFIETQTQNHYNHLKSSHHHHLVQVRHQNHNAATAHRMQNSHMQMVDKQQQVNALFVGVEVQEMEELRKHVEDGVRALRQGMMRLLEK